MKKSVSYFLQLIVISLFMACTQSKPDDRKHKHSTEILNKKIKKVLYDFINNNSKDYKAYQVFISCDNKRISLVTKPSISKFEILSSPIDEYLLYNNMLIIFYAGTDYIFNTQNNTANYKYMFIDQFIKDNAKYILNDMDSTGKHIHDSASHLMSHSYVVQFVYYYDKDSLIVNLPYKDFESKTIQQAREEKTKFEFDYTPE